MRLRAAFSTLLALGLVLGALAPSSVLAKPAKAVRSADAAAPTMRTLYISGQLLGSNGTPSLLVGLAAVSVDSTGAFSGTMTMGGTTPLTTTVTGTISNTMTLSGTIGGQQVSVTARAVKERIGNPSSSGPSTTAGMEFQGAAVVDSTPIGYVTAIDTSIMQNYSFAATVSKGTDSGMDINGSLYALSDHRGDLHGYFQDDATSAVYPLLSGTLARNQMLIHVDLLGHGNLVGVGAVSSSILNNTLIYKGTLYGPALNDTGTWYGSPAS